MNKSKKTKKMDRRDFIKKGIQMAGAGVIASGLSSCNLLLDETPGGGLALKGDCGKILYQTTGNALAIIDLNRDFEITSVPGVVVDTLGSFSLSPSRSKIAYALLGDLRSVNVDGTGDIFVQTDRNVAKQGIWNPHYSSDGTKIAFYETVGLGGPEGIYTINTDSSGISGPFPSSPITVNFPIWSPDGSKIAYISGGNLLSMTASGTALGVPNVAADNTSRPSWSSDGSQILYTSGGNIYVVNSGGGSPVSLGLSGTFPSYSPSCSQISYVSGNQIYFANKDGSNVKSCPNVTNAVAIEWR